MTKFSSGNEAPFFKIPFLGSPTARLGPPTASQERQRHGRRFFLKWKPEVLTYVSSSDELEDILSRFCCIQNKPLKKKLQNNAKYGTRQSKMSNGTRAFEALNHKIKNDLITIKKWRRRCHLP